MSTEAIMAALVASNGKVVDSRNARIVHIPAVAIFSREDAMNAVVPLLENQVFRIVHLVLKNGVVFAGNGEYFGLADSCGISIETAVTNFNATSNHELRDIVYFNKVDEEAKQIPVYVADDFVSFSNTHLHDDSGTIFTPRHLEATSTTPEGISWDLALDPSLSINNVFVREYGEYGDISHYVRLPVMIKLLEYTDFCIENEIHYGVLRNMVYIKKAIADFLSTRRK